MISFTPTRGIKTPLYMPHPVEIPAGQLEIIAFDFPSMGELSTVEMTRDAQAPFVIWGITVRCKRDADGAAGTYFLQLYHNHAGAQREIFSKAIPGDLMNGTAQKPIILPDTYLIDESDTITVEVKNVTPGVAGGWAAATAQVCVWGVRPA